MSIIIQIQRRLGVFERIVSRRLLRRTSGVVRFWQSLNLAQRCYAAATLVFFSALFFGLQGSFYKVVIGVLVTIAILYEFWPRFMLVWNSLPGRAFILFIYAVIANFALASASGLVNSVSGVSAASLPYSHNFAIILMLPSWFFITTLLALVLVQLLMPLYLLVLLLLKPFGVHGLWHAPEYRFVFTTALIRYGWMLLVLVKVVEVSMESGIVSFFSDTPSELVSTSSKVKDKGVIAAQIGNPTKPVTLAEAANSIKAQIKAELEDEFKPATALEADLNTLPESLSGNASETTTEEERVVGFDLSAQGAAFRLMQKQLLAEFIFNYEADEFSRCANPEGTRVVELNDYEILTIRPLENDDIGYTYTVIPCRSAAIGNDVTP
jgi:hypothetical protein